MMDRGTVRNLDQLQEEQPVAVRTPRSVTVALVAVSGACIVFMAMALGGRRSSTDAKKADPLGELVALRGKGAVPTRATDLGTADVTFPGILSDQANPTTALAALRGQPNAQGVGATTTTGAPAAAVTVAPPPATDRLSVMPLPAQHVLQASPVVTRPRDSLTRAASESAQANLAGTPSVAGREGGYQLQVSSFRAQPEAQAFAEQLRARGHKAYVVEAHVPGRGTWYRVRVGPFANHQTAAAYRSTFETKEHVVPFLVSPTGE